MIGKEWDFDFPVPPWLMVGSIALVLIAASWLLLRKHR
jgi:hypothetical protein